MRLRHWLPDHRWWWDRRDWPSHNHTYWEGWEAKIKPGAKILPCLPGFLLFVSMYTWLHHNKLENFKEMGIPDHLTCLLRNLYAGQEATVRTGHGKTDWFQIRKGVCQGCILLPCLFNFYAEYIMRNAGLDEARAGIKVAGEISITSDMQMTPPLWQKVKKN